MADSILRRTFRYRLYPTRTQAAVLEEQLAEACRLYNAALQERRDAWKVSRTRITFYMQDAQLKDIRAAGDVGLPNFTVARDVLRRVDHAFQAFFRRVKEKRGKAGFPRFKSSARYNSITLPAYGYGARLFDNRLRVHGIGLVKIKLHRPIDGDIKIVTIKREAGQWYALFSCLCEAQPLPSTDAAVGVDVGLTTFATLSDGTAIPNPRHARAAERYLRRCQRRVARRRKGSQRRRKAVRLLQRAHAQVRNRRGDFHHKVARDLVNRFDVIAVEDLDVKGLASGTLGKSVHDAGWAEFLNCVRYKAENAGRCMIEVNPRGTSQTCLCGARVAKTLNDRTHVCLACGLVGDRDHIAAQVILQLARTGPSGVNVGDRTPRVA